MNYDFHNPDSLTPEQVGEGYRLLLKSEFGRQEELHQEIETWLQLRKDWYKSKIGYLGNSEFRTYRVPLSTWPLPEEDHHRELKEAHAAGKTLQWKFKGEETWMTKTANFADYPDNCDYRIKPEEPWTEWHGGECPLKDDEVEEWEYKISCGAGEKFRRKPSTMRWRHIGSGGDIIAYRVLKWKEKPQITGQTGPADMPNKCGPSAADFEPAPLDNDRWESLLHKNSTLEKRVKELEVELTSVRPYADAYQRVAGRLGVKANLIKVIDEKDDQIVAAFKGIHELQSKITAAQERLAQLEWRPVSVMPTKEDADPFGNVQVCGITDNNLQSHGLHNIHYPFKDRDTHWRPAALPTILDPSREEFERFFQERGDGYMPKTQDALFDLWKAARRTK